MNIDFLCTATFQPVISKHFHLLIVINEKSMANLIYLPNFQTCLNTREHRLSFCMTKLYWIGNPHFCGWNQRYLLLRAFFNVCKIFYFDFYVIWCFGNESSVKLRRKVAFYLKGCETSLRKCSDPFKQKGKSKVKLFFHEIISLIFCSMI